MLSDGHVVGRTHFQNIRIVNVTRFTASTVRRRNSGEVPYSIAIVPGNCMSKEKSDKNGICRTIFGRRINNHYFAAHFSKIQGVN